MNQKSTLLIVDDQENNRDLLEAVLADEGYHLEFASDGLEALTKAKEVRPDLILLDVMMPNMNGFEVCRRLRADPHMAEVPVIMVTALNDREDWLKGFEAGTDDFISKPINQVEIQTRVRGMMRLNRYRRLRQERHKFEWVVEHATDGYLIVDNQEQIQYANQQARHVLGLTIEDDVSQLGPFLSLARQQYSCQPAEAWADWPAQTDEQEVRYLVRPETSTAKARWLQVDMLAIEPLTESTGNKVIRLQDVTSELTLQRDNWNFNSVVAHKLRTPLNGLLYGLEVLAESAEELSRQELTEFAEITFESMQRLQGQIEDILQYVDSSNLTKPGLGFSLAQIKPTINKISQALDLETVSVTSCEGLAKARVLLSPQAIELILWELLENAKKFHPNHSPTVEVTIFARDAGQVCIQVTDDGLSLSPEQLNRIWSPYYQAEKYRTGEVAGMGLGLSMVATMIWGVGGTCRAYNRSGGSGIRVELVLGLEKSGLEM